MNIMTKMFKHCQSSKAKKESWKTMDYDPLQKCNNEAKHNSAMALPLEGTDSKN